MPDKVIEIPGVGNISFPDTMSDADINAAAAKLYREKQGALGVAAQPTAEPGAASRFISGVARTSLPSTTAADYLAGPAYALRHPLDAAGLLAGGVREAHAEQGRQFVAAGQRLGQAQTMRERLIAASELAGRGAATLLPIIGPAAANVGETLGSGDIAGGLGEATGLIGSTFAPRAAAATKEGVAARIGPRLVRSAEQDIREALAPTRHRTKVKTERILPEVRRRGITGNLEELRELTRENVSKLDRQIGQTLGRFANRPVDIQPVRQQLAGLKARTYRDISQPNGTTQRAIHNPRKYAQIESVENLLNKYGNTMTVDQAHAVRKAWDDIVSKAGGFDEKAGSGAFGVSLDDWSEANVKRPLAGALRQELRKAVPEIRALNQEYGFWRDLQDIVNATKFRRVGQRRGGLIGKTVGAGSRAAGTVIGAQFGVEGAVAGALVGGEIGERLNRLFTSSSWRLMSAQRKNALADALVSGSQPRIAVALAGLEAAQTGLRPVPSHLPAAAQRDEPERQYAR